MNLSVIEKTVRDGDNDIDGRAARNKNPKKREDAG